MVEFEKLLYSPNLQMITRFSCYESFPKGYVQMSLCFTLTRDPMSRNGPRQSFLVAWVCTAARLPLEKIASWQTTYHCPSSWRDSAQLEKTLRPGVFKVRVRFSMKPWFSHILFSTIISFTSSQNLAFDPTRTKDRTFISPLKDSLSVQTMISPGFITGH